MGLYDHLGPRLLSRPVKCHWAGWETDTYRLQQAGWRLSALQDVPCMQMMLAIDHPHLGLRGMTQRIDWKYGMEDHMERDLPMHCNFRDIGKTILIHAHGEFDFRPIDATPQFREGAPRRLEDLAHFAPAPLVHTKAIVLPEPDVDELLNRILEKQAKAKTDYFRDIVATEGGILKPHKFHAQIISLDEARKAA